MAQIIRHPRTAAPLGIQPRTREDILAELEGVHARRKSLYEELALVEDVEAGAPQRLADPGGPIVSLAEAAHAVGWSEQRTRRHIVAHNAKYPNDKLGWQAGGLENGRWSIPLNRWRRYVEHAPGSDQ